MNYVLSFREKATGGAVVPGRLEAGAGLGTNDQLRSEPRLTFLLHGFNVDYASGKDALLRFAGLLPATAGGGVVATLWPGDHWTGPLSYSYEGRDADDTAAALARFIGNEVRTTVPISFVAHSLGNRVAMETAAAIGRRGYTVAQLCLMAAAIDADSLASPKDYLVPASEAGRVAVLWSRKDTVLKFAYPAGDLLQAFIFWDDSKGLALGYRGPRPYKGTAVPASVMEVRIPNWRKANHGDYLPADPPNLEQLSAARFADAVLDGVDSPSYGGRDSREAEPH